MLQIIGWTLCLCLIVKGMEVLGQGILVKGTASELMKSAGVIAIVGAFGAAFLIYAQGAAIGGNGNSTNVNVPDYIDVNGVDPNVNH